MDKKDAIIEKQDKIIDKLIYEKALSVMYYDSENDIAKYAKQLKQKLYKEIT